MLLISRSTDPSPPFFQFDTEPNFSFFYCNALYYLLYGLVRGAAICGRGSSRVIYRAENVEQPSGDDDGAVYDALPGA